MASSINPGVTPPVSPQASYDRSFTRRRGNPPPLQSSKKRPAAIPAVPMASLTNKTQRLAQPFALSLSASSPVPASPVLDRSRISPTTIESSIMPRSPSTANTAASAAAAAAASFSISGSAARQIVQNRPQMPEGPRKNKKARSVFGLVPTYNGYPLEHFTNPPIIEALGLIERRSDGKYKRVWEIPEGNAPLIPGIANDELLILTLADNDRTFTPARAYFHMQKALEQYNQAIHYFGQNRCVQIFNADTALDDGYFVVKKINHSLMDVFNNSHLTRQFTSIDQLDNLSADETIVLGLLSQIKVLFDLSMQHEIDTDLHVGNFRVEIEGPAYSLKLTDFREVEDDTDLNERIVNKSKEIEGLKKELVRFFSPQFIDQYFKDTIEMINGFMD